MHLAQFLIHLFGITLVAASNDKSFFTSPVSSTGVRPVFTLGDQLLVSWVTDLGEFNITFWQQSLVQESAASQGNIYSKIHSSDQVTNFTWTVQLLGFDLSYSNQFFLWVNPDGPDGFVSTYFNITEPTSTTTRTATAAIATSINTSNLAAPVSSTSAVATDLVASFSANPASSADLTTTSKIALGVGIGFGLPVLCALGALIWIRIRQDSKNKKENNNQMKENSISAPMTGPSSGTVAPWTITEMHKQPSQSMYRSHDMGPKELQPSGFDSNNRFELPHSPYR